MADFIDQLRQVPETAMQIHDVYFDFRGVQNEIVSAYSDERGTRCTFTAVPSQYPGIVPITVKSGGIDYYFPWIPRGVGSVVVPVAAPDGTIVATGQLNGCTFEVIQSGSNLHFYHDGDSKYLRKTVMPVAGDQLCAVTPDDYMPGELGHTIMQITQKLASATNDNTKTRAYCYQLFAVKKNGFWKVFSCGLLLFNGVAMETFKEKPVKLVASFLPSTHSAANPMRRRAATI